MLGYTERLLNKDKHTLIYKGRETRLQSPRQTTSSPREVPETPPPLPLHSDAPHAPPIPPLHQHFPRSHVRVQHLGFGFRVSILGFGIRVPGSGLIKLPSRGPGFLVSVSGSRLPAFDFRVSGVGFRDSGFRFWESRCGIRDSGFGFGDSGFGFGDSGLGIRDSGFGHVAPPASGRPAPP